jgi:hypothetical protein
MSKKAIKSALENIAGFEYAIKKKSLTTANGTPLISPIEGLVFQSTGPVSHDKGYLTEIYRNNLLNLIINAYNEGIHKFNLSKNYVYLIYKGGNIIESTMQSFISNLINIKPDFFKKTNINIYEDINETGLLNDQNSNELFFDTTIEINRFFKRSDIDLAVYVDYCEFVLNLNTIDSMT